MTDREFFVETLAGEIPRFERVFKALPEDKLDYKHPGDAKGKSAGELVNMLATEASTFIPMLDTGVVNMDEFSWAEKRSLIDATTLLVNSFKAAHEKAQATSEEDWAKPAQMMMGGKSGWDTTRGGMAWGFILDAIHHRGQLSTYIRPMGGMVPSIYGPSADSAE